MSEVYLELAPHLEAKADSSIADYDDLRTALDREPLHHQWLTYQAREADIVVNSYNTGTGKTKAALLRLLDLKDEYQKYHRNANVLFIAPTNELLRQHEGDVADFITHNKLPHLPLRLDAPTIRELATLHLDDKFQRSGERLDKMLENPRSVLPEEQRKAAKADSPYVLIINPDIFYYALYGLGNVHDQRVLFRHFVEDFRYIIVDELHYYNAKQLANFLFFIALLREWGYFGGNERRQVCLLTATPVSNVDRYFDNLGLSITRVAPHDQPADLELKPALAPLRLHLFSEAETSDGLVDKAAAARPSVLRWLADDQHGAFISSALWRVNLMFQQYKDLGDRVGRLTGAERQGGREQAKRADLMMATPTVDIGYNFERENWPRQNIDFLLFDARTSDEFIQRLGRAGRVLSKEQTDVPSEAWAVVPDELTAALRERNGHTLTRQELNTIVKATLPVKNGIYDYIRSGAIIESFLPIFNYAQSLPSEREEQMQRLYNSLRQVYDTRNGLTFKAVKWHIRRYLALRQREAALRAEVKASAKNDFQFGEASLMLMEMAAQTEDVPSVTPDQVARMSSYLHNGKRWREREEVVAQREELLEEYYAAAARFNFRDSFQPPQACVYDPQHYLSSEDYASYSALHIVQNYEGEWLRLSDALPPLPPAVKQTLDPKLTLYCRLRAQRSRPISIYFTLKAGGLSKTAWEERYLSKLTAAAGFSIVSADGASIPALLNTTLAQDYTAFYAVPSVGAEAATLNKLKHLTALYTNTLKVHFDEVGEQEYILVLGNAALLVACEAGVIGAKYAAQRATTRHAHIFDWEGNNGND